MKARILKSQEYRVHPHTHSLAEAEAKPRSHSCGDAALPGAQVLLHCQMNMRASAVKLFCIARSMRRKIPPKAWLDVKKLWTPKDQWAVFVDDQLRAHKIPFKAEWRFPQLPAMRFRIVILSLALCGCRSAPVAISPEAITANGSCNLPPNVWRQIEAPVNRDQLLQLPDSATSAEAVAKHFVAGIGRAEGMVRRREPQSESDACTIPGARCPATGANSIW